MKKEEKEKTLQAGKIAKEVRNWIKPQIKKGTPLIEIAEKIENKIVELGGKPAFPTNLSINEIAAHYTPGYDDETLAEGLLKIDFGVHIDGWVSDNAFSIDLENNEENKKLIISSENALKEAIKIFQKGVDVGKIGETIQRTIESENFSPVVNLSGHSIEQYDLHSGVTIPNIKEERGIIIEEGIYAIEPFSTNGGGKVSNGKPSGIYMFLNDKLPRGNSEREILNFIIEEYQTLPFCSRWLVKEFGTRALFALKQLENSGNLHHFEQLVEKSSNIKEVKISQAEHTILVDEKEVIVTTE